MRVARTSQPLGGRLALLTTCYGYSPHQPSFAGPCRCLTDCPLCTGPITTGNDEQRSAAQLLRSPLPDSDVHPVTWKAAHTSGQIYEMKADDVQHWEYVQPEQEAAGSGEGGACSGNAGNGQQLLVDAIRDHQDQADELYGRDLR